MIISYKSQSVPEQLYAPDSDWLLFMISDQKSTSVP